MVSKAAALLTAAPSEPEELENNDESDWPAKGSDVDPGIRRGKEVEITNQCGFGVYELQLTSSQNWNDYKWLSVRWVLQKRGHMWWCERIAKDFKASNPKAPGLFICASFLMAFGGRMNNYYAVTHPDYEMMVGIIVQDELVICEAPEEVKMLARQMERDAGSVDEAEELTPIRFEEISSGPQIGEFGVEMRHPQPRDTVDVLELQQDGVRRTWASGLGTRLSEDLGKTVTMECSSILLPSQNAGSPAPVGQSVPSERTEPPEPPERSNAAEMLETESAEEIQERLYRVREQWSWHREIKLARQRWQREEMLRAKEMQGYQLGLESDKFKWWSKVWNDVKESGDTKWWDKKAQDDHDDHIHFNHQHIRHMTRVWNEKYWRQRTSSTFKVSHFFFSEDVCRF